MHGYQSKPDENMNPSTNEVGPDYFRTMGLPLVAGREFTDRDVAGAPLVAIVNETFAKHLLPGRRQSDRAALRLPRSTRIRCRSRSSAS